MIRCDEVFSIHGKRWDFDRGGTCGDNDIGSGNIFCFAVIAYDLDFCFGYEFSKAKVTGDFVFLHEVLYPGSHFANDFVLSLLHFFDIDFNGTDRDTMIT